MVRLLIFLISLGVRAIRAMSRSRDNLVIENLALRQQIAALKKNRGASGDNSSTQHRTDTLAAHSSTD